MNEKPNEKIVTREREKEEEMEVFLCIYLKNVLTRVGVGDEN